MDLSKAKKSVVMPQAPEANKIDTQEIYAIVKQSVGKKTKDLEDAVKKCKDGIYKNTIEIKKVADKGDGVDRSVEILKNEINILKA